jgi:hypothetical protein
VVTNAAIVKMLVVLRDERDRLRVEAAQVSTELERVEQAVRAVEDLVDKGREESDGLDAQGRMRRPRGRRSVREMVLLVMAETPERRWTRQELVAELSGRGVDWVGDLHGSVSNALNMLAKQHQVVHDPSGQWRLMSSNGSVSP